MNAQERESLASLLAQLTQAQIGPKDPEAQRMIQEACARQPDAVYLLVQRVLLLEQALRTERDASRHVVDARFPDPNAWGNAPTPQRPAAAGAANWGGSFLGNLASTAAGVVAGSFLFLGIEHLMAGHSGHAAASGSQGFLDNAATTGAYDTAGTDAADLAALSDFSDSAGGDDWI